MNQKRTGRNENESRAGDKRVPRLNEQEGKEAEEGAPAVQQAQKKTESLQQKLAAIAREWDKLVRDLKKRKVELEKTIPQLDTKLKSIEERVETLRHDAETVARMVYEEPTWTKLKAVERDLNDVKSKLELGETRRAACERMMAQMCGRDTDLEAWITNKFPQLEDVVVSISRDIGPLAARVFEYLVRPAHQPPDHKPGVALSGGRAIRDMVTNIKARYYRLAVYPLSCAALPSDVAISADTAIGLLCAKYEGTEVEGKSVPISIEATDSIAPAVTRKLLRAMEQDVADYVRFAFTGIGALTEKAAIVKLYNRYVVEHKHGGPDIKRAIEELRGMRVVGDVLYRGIAQDGTIISIEPDLLEPRILGIGPESLRDTLIGQEPKLPASAIVGVAPGAEKAKPIIGAIKKRYINILVTDEAAARAIKDELRQGEG